MAWIDLKNGGVVFVDDEDYDWLNRYTWFHDGQGYAVTNMKNGRYSSRLMHRWLCPTKPKQDVDHINNDTLDNTRDNLRACSRANNLHNSKKHKDNKVGYKGVYFTQKKYRADIMCKGKRYYIGSFNTAKQAAKAYDDWAKKLHGKFAKTNF